MLRKISLVWLTSHNIPLSPTTTMASPKIPEDWKAPVVAVPSVPDSAWWEIIEEGMVSKCSTCHEIPF
jgi:hypothetical protein